MDQAVETLKSLQGSYSGAFVLFWGCMLIACIGQSILQRRTSSLSLKIENGLFWVFGLAMIGFTAIRPIGIARDDLAYLEIFKTICPTLECGQWIQSPRDWGWYSLIGFLKSFWPEPRVMLVIAAASAAIKLWVIFKLSKRPLWALLFFTAVFYEVQDLTAFRVSLSLAIFMMAIYLLIKRYRFSGFIAILTPGLFHKQALLAPLVLLSGILNRRYTVFAVLTLLPIGLLLLGVSYQGYREIVLYQTLPWLQPIIQQGLDSYIAAGQAGIYDKIRVMPYSYLPLIMLMVCCSKDIFSTNKDLFRYSAMSMVITCWLAWLFAGWQEPQARFFEFCALPSVLLVGNFNNKALINLAVILASGMFIVRYNLLHPLLG